MDLIIPVTGAIDAISPPKKFGGNTQTIEKSNGSDNIDLLFKLAANSVKVRLIRWIGDAATGFYTVHQSPEDTVDTAAQDKGRTWLRFVCNDQPGDYAVWLTAGNVADVAKCLFEACRRKS